MTSARSSHLLGARVAARIALATVCLLVQGLGCTLISGVGSLHEVSCSGDCGEPSDASDARGDGSPADRGPDAGDAPSSDLGSETGGMLIFDEEFDGGTLDLMGKWTAAGDGVWSIEGAHGVQSNANTGNSILFATAFASATNYHIVARMRSTGPFGKGYDLAPEIAFRVDPTVDAGGIPETYHCNMDLLQDQLIIDQTTPEMAGQITEVGFTLPMGFDLSTPFVLDAVVAGDSVTCTATVDTLGVVATVSTSMLTRLTGSFGLKTYDTAAEFFYFRVYALP